MKVKQKTMNAVVWYIFAIFTIASWIWTIFSIIKWIVCLFI
jgi:hypothetical protein